MNPTLLKYCGIVSTRVERYAVKSRRPYKANMRCPMCGDSRKSKTKARGWILETDDGGAVYFCHNCGASTSFTGLLKFLDNSLMNEYLRESAIDNFTRTKPRKALTPKDRFEEKMKRPKFISDTPLKNLKKISQLDWNHPAKKYVQDRLIPPVYHSKLFYAPEFKKFVNTIVPDKFKPGYSDGPRLVIPLLDKERNLFGFQGRALYNSKVKYITIILDDSKPRVYGMESCDTSVQHYILEGPIDAMFVKNSLAMIGGSPDWKVPNSNSVFVYDNEPRNKDTISRMHKAIKRGYKMFFWPAHIKEKDVNAYIMNHPDSNFMEVLLCNVYSGMEAEMKLIDWSKV